MRRTLSGAEPYRMSENLAEEVTEFLKMTSSILEEDTGPMGLPTLAWRVFREIELKPGCQEVVEKLAQLQNKNGNIFET